MKLKRISVLLLSLAVCVSPSFAQRPSENSNPHSFSETRSANIRSEQTGPALLTYDEIVQLYQQADPPEPLRQKLQQLLNTPFVSNWATASGLQPLKPSDPRIGKFLRVAEWNIERGLEFDAVAAAFTDPRKFSLLMDQKDSRATPDERAQILDQVRLLKQADLLVLNEVDWGINRTLFLNVAADLAERLGMNYAYGVEFVEVDPTTMGIDEQVVLREVAQTYATPDDSKSEMIERVMQIMRPDPARYRGLHGTAILSRYHLTNVRLIPFKQQGHDWYADEKKKLAPAAKAEGKLSMEVFKEQLVRQVRRGGRMMLVADIVDPELPSGPVTVVATHLEDMTTPANRRKQLEELLAQIRNVKNPVIVAGDMNTSAHDAAPISVTRALKQRFGSEKWWAEEGASEAIRRATPFGWAYDIRGLIGLARGVDDPTVRSVPLVGKNPEAAFFTRLEQFRFADENAFDFRGDQRRSSNGRGGNLANSNERGEKGFAPTSELGRTYGPIGKFKLDWIFVRPIKLTDPHGGKQSYRFAPHFGRNLKALNQSIPERISDHNPITVDLPLNEPPAKTKNRFAPPRHETEAPPRFLH